MKFRNWIFDWSGTLVDDLGPVVDATNDVMDHYGKNSYTRESFRQAFRLPYEEFYKEILPEVSLEEIEVFFRQGFQNSQKGVEVLPYVRGFLEYLKSIESRIFILTSMDSEAFDLQQVETGLNVFFESTYSSILDKRECIGKLLENHRLDPQETVFVGDMVHDIETAKYGGLCSIAVLTGYNDADRLARAEPSLITPHLGHLEECLRRK